jgi:hypothetical protein
MEPWELVARECCRDTLARYSHAGDRFRLEEFAAAFCEDGVLQVRDAEPVAGRAAIVERFSGGIGRAAPADAAKTTPKATRIVRHNVTNIRFESVSPSEANVASYFTVFTNIGVDHMGRYRDRLVPVGGEWLIAHRFVSTDWRSPDSLFGAGA